MHARFAQSVALTVAGGFIVVASQAFAVTTTAWLAFALGLGAVVLATVPALAGERRDVIGLDGLLAVLGAWTVVASLVFHGTTSEWLSFAEGAGVVLVALAGLTVDHVRLATATRSTAPVSVESRPAAVTPVAA